MHHSLVCLSISQKLSKPAIVQLWSLWHDAHESVTGDIPTTWKTPDIRTAQHDLDERFMDYLGIAPSLADIADVSAVDRIAFLAESWVLGPPGIKEWAGLDRPPLFIGAVRAIARAYKNPINTNGLISTGVRRFAYETDSLLQIVLK